MRDLATVAGRGQLLLSGSVAHAFLKTAVDMSDGGNVEGRGEGEEERWYSRATFSGGREKEGPMGMPKITLEVAYFHRDRMKYVDESQDYCHRRYGSYTYLPEQLVE